MTTKTEELKPRELHLNGRDWAVEPCTALSAVTAMGIIARHAKALGPALQKCVDMVEKGEKVEKGGKVEEIDQTQFVLEIVSDLASILEAPSDVFRVLALLSGVEQETLERSQIVEIIPVVKAVWAKNNVAGLIGMAVEKEA